MSNPDEVNNSDIEINLSNLNLEDQEIVLEDEDSYDGQNVSDYDPNASGLEYQDDIHSEIETYLRQNMEQSPSMEMQHGSMVMNSNLHGSSLNSQPGGNSQLNNVPFSQRETEKDKIQFSKLSKNSAPNEQLQTSQNTFQMDQMKDVDPINDNLQQLSQIEQNYEEDNFLLDDEDEGSGNLSIELSEDGADLGPGSDYDVKLSQLSASQSQQQQKLSQFDSRLDNSGSNDGQEQMERMRQLTQEFELNQETDQNTNSEFRRGMGMVMNRASTFKGRNLVPTSFTSPESDIESKVQVDQETDLRGEGIEENEEDEQYQNELEQVVSSMLGKSSKIANQNLGQIDEEDDEFDESEASNLAQSQRTLTQKSQLNGSNLQFESPKPDRKSIKQTLADVINSVSPSQQKKLDQEFEDTPQPMNMEIKQQDLSVDPEDDNIQTVNIDLSSVRKSFQKKSHLSKTPQEFNTSSIPQSKNSQMTGSVQDEYDMDNIETPKMSQYSNSQVELINSGHIPYSNLASSYRASENSLNIEDNIVKDSFSNKSKSEAPEDSPIMQAQKDVLNSTSSLNKNIDMSKISNYFSKVDEAIAKINQETNSVLTSSPAHQKMKNRDFAEVSRQIARENLKKQAGLQTQSFINPTTENMDNSVQRKSLNLVVKETIQDMEEEGDEGEEVEDLVLVEAKVVLDDKIEAVEVQIDKKFKRIDTPVIPDNIPANQDTPEMQTIHEDELKLQASIDNPDQALEPSLELKESLRMPSMSQKSSQRSNLSTSQNKLSSRTAQNIESSVLPLDQSDPNFLNTLLSQTSKTGSQNQSGPLNFGRTTQQTQKSKVTQASKLSTKTAFNNSKFQNIEDMHVNKFLMSLEIIRLNRMYLEKHEEETFTSTKLEEMLDVVEKLKNQQFEDLSTMQAHHRNENENLHLEIQNLKEQLHKATMVNSRLNHSHQSLKNMTQSKLSHQNNSILLKSGQKSSMMSSEFDKEELQDEVHSLHRSNDPSESNLIQENDPFEGNIESNWNLSKILMAFEIERVMVQRDEGYQMLQIAQQEKEDIIDKCHLLEQENSNEINKLVKNVIEVQNQNQRLVDDAELKENIVSSCKQEIQNMKMILEKLKNENETLREDSKSSKLDFEKLMAHNESLNLEIESLKKDASSNNNNLLREKLELISNSATKKEPMSKKVELQSIMVQTDPIPEVFETKSLLEQDTGSLNQAEDEEQLNSQTYESNLSRKTNKFMKKIDHSVSDMKLSTPIDKKNYNYGHQTTFTLSKDDQYEQFGLDELQDQVILTNADKSSVKTENQRIVLLEAKLKQVFKENTKLKMELSKHSDKGRSKEQLDFARKINSYKRSLQRVKIGSKGRFDEIKGLLDMETKRRREIEEQRKRTLDHNQYLLQKMTKIYKVEDQLHLMTERLREGIDTMVGNTTHRDKSKAGTRNLNQPGSRGPITRRSSISSNNQNQAQNLNGMAKTFDQLKTDFLMNTPGKETTELTDIRIPINLPSGNRKRVKTPSPRHSRAQRNSNPSTPNTDILKTESYHKQDDRPTLFKFNINNNQLKNGHSPVSLNQFNQNPDLSLSKAFNHDGEESIRIQNYSSPASNLSEKYQKSLKDNQQAYQIVDEKQKQLMFEKEMNSKYQDRIKELEAEKIRLVEKMRYPGQRKYE